MYGIQEMVSHTEPNLKKIKEYMDENAMYHPYDVSIYEGLSRSVQRTVRESLREIPIHEFLDKTSATSGAYLVAAKIWDELYYASKQYDICPLIGNMAYDWAGNSLSVDIAVDDSYRAYKISSGGKAPDSNIATVQATITPETYAVPVMLTSTLVEDGAWPLIEWHVSQAGKAIGEQVSNAAISVLKTGTDGDGTVNSSATGDADETKWTGGTTSDIESAIRALGDDKFIGNTLLSTSEAFMHSISTTAAEIGWANMAPLDGYTSKIGFLDVLINNSELLHAAGDLAGAAMTDCVTVVFDRRNALLTGRKRWLRVENYANPVEDLSGAVVTARQDSISIYDDSIYVLTET